MHVDLGNGYVVDDPQNGELSYQQLYQEGYPSDSSFTATVTATDIVGLVTTVSAPFTAPSCP